MAALSAARSTIQMEGRPLPPVQNFPVKGSTTIYQGSLVALNAGYAAPGAVATGRIAVGRARATVANAGADGAVTVETEPGIFKWGNSTSTDAIAQADVGAACYIVDDQTVAKTNGSSSRSLAGIIVQVDMDGVWVQTGLGISA